MNQTPEETPEPSTSAATPSLIVEPLEEVSGHGEVRIPHKSPQNHKKKAKKAKSPQTNEKNTRGSKKAQIIKKQIARKDMGNKRPRRIYRTKASTLLEIRKYQKSVDNLIPKIAFQRLCREYMNREYPRIRVTPQCLAALQEGTETFIVELMEESNRCTHHANRVTLMPRDMRLAKRLKKID